MNTESPLYAEARSLIKIAVPAVVSQLAQMSMGVIDTIMSGNLGAEALAAISVGSNLLMPVIVFTLGIFMALNPLVAQASGARLNHLFWGYAIQGSYLALMLSIPAILLLYELEPLMNAIGVQPSIIPVVVDYLKAVSLGIIPLLLFLVLRFINEGLFSTHAIMYVSIGAIPINIGLNYVFMYGYFGVPAYGAVGLGYATAIVWTLMFISLLIYTLSTEHLHVRSIRQQSLRPNFQKLKEILTLGIPVALTVGLEIMMFAVIGLMIGRYAIEIIAAHQIAVNIASITFMVPLGISTAVTARVGYARGANSHIGVIRAGYLGLGLSVCFMSLAALIMYSFATELISIYNDEAGVLEIGVGLLYLAAIFQLFDGMQVTAAGALRGLKDMRYPLIVSFISYWIAGFPLGYYLAEVSGMGAQGYWAGFISGLGTAAILLNQRFYSLAVKRA